MKTPFDNRQLDSTLNRSSAALLVFCLTWCIACTPPANDAKTPSASASVQAPQSSTKTREGIDAIHAKNYAKAKELLTAAHAEAPQDTHAVFYLGVAEQELGNKREAIKAFRDVLVIDPKLIEASINLSALLLETRTKQDAAEAARVAEEALKYAPDSKELLMNRAVALADSGDIANATAAYAKIVATSPQDLRTRYEYARVLSEAGQKEQATSELETVGKSDDSKLLAAAGSLLAKLGAAKQCVDVFDRVIEKSPGAEALVRRGNCKKALRDYEGERADYAQAIKTDDKFAPAYYHLGMHAHFIGKDDKQALAMLEKVKELGPGTPIAAEADKAIALLKQTQPKPVEVKQPRGKQKK